MYKSVALNCRSSNIISCYQKANYILFFFTLLAFISHCDLEKKIFKINNYSYEILQRKQHIFTLYYEYKIVIKK